MRERWFLSRRQRVVCEDFGYPVPEDRQGPRSILDIKHDVPGRGRGVFEEASWILRWSEAGVRRPPLEYSELQPSLMDVRRGTQCDARGRQLRSYILRSARVVDITQALELSAEEETADRASASKASCSRQIRMSRLVGQCWPNFLFNLNLIIDSFTIQELEGFVYAVRSMRKQALQARNIAKIF